MKRNIILFFLALIITSLLQAQDSHSIQQGDLGNGTFINPLLGGDYPDPTIIRDGKDYYMTHSAFDYLPGLTIFHSIDLINWKPISYALTKYLGSVWAPDICKYKEKYYIYFTVSERNGSYSNYVVYASTPRGPWSDPIRLNVGKWIDPCHVADEENDQRWLFASGGRRIPLTPDGLAVKGETEMVYNGWPIPQNWAIESPALEGPKMKKIGEYYFFLNAQGGTAGPPTSHMVVVARSKSIDGPWENSPTNPLIHTYEASERWWSKGHGSLIDTPDGEWWIVYHAYEKNFFNLGRQTLIEPVTLTQDGWLKAGSGRQIERPIQKPIISHTKGDYRNTLKDFQIGLNWKFYKQYDPKRISVDNRVLTMKAQGANPADSAPMMFVAGAHRYELSVKVESSNSSVAGIVLYYNTNFYVGIGRDKEHKYRWRRGVMAGKSQCSGKTPTWIKLRNIDNVVTGYYSYDGVNWEQESWGMEISGYNHNTLSDFQSVLPGLFVYGEGEARFSDFKFNLVE